MGVPLKIEIRTFVDSFDTAMLAGICNQGEPTYPRLSSMQLEEFFPRLIALVGHLEKIEAPVDFRKLGVSFDEVVGGIRCRVELSCYHPQDDRTFSISSFTYEPIEKISIEDFVSYVVNGLNNGLAKMLLSE